MTRRLTDKGCRYMGSVTEMSGASIGADLDGVHPKPRSEGGDIVTGKSDEAVRLFAFTMGKWANSHTGDILRFSVLIKDTQACRLQEPGTELRSFTSPQKTLQ